MKVQVSRPLSALSIVATIAFASFTASAQTTPMMGGEMKGCDMMGGDMTRMTQMMPMMHEKLSMPEIVSRRSRLISRSPRRKCRYGRNSPMRSSRRPSRRKSRWKACTSR
jgi:hypothetical protein